MTDPDQAGSPAPAAAWRAELLDRLALGAARATAAWSKLHDGVLSEVHELRVGAQRFIVKLYRFDLQAAVTRDPDPRFEAAARWMAFAPYFAASDRRVAAFRAHVSLALPRTLAEGRLTDGPWYSVLEPLAGRRAPDLRDRSASERRRRSAELGAVLRQLHAAPVTDPVPWTDAAGFCDEWAQIWHALVDALPEAAAGSRAERLALHRRIHRQWTGLASAHLGPTVLIHGDFGPANVLCDAGGAPAALLDFQLCCPARAFLDLRWLDTFDAEAFLDAYGWPGAARASAPWLGGFAALFWEALILLVLHRFATFPVPAAYVQAVAARFRERLAFVERHGPGARG